MDGKQVARSLAAAVIKLAVAVLVVLLVYKIAVSAYTFGFRIFAEKPMTEGEGITVTVVYSETDSIKDLGQKLYDQGLIRDTKLFYFHEMFSDYHGIVQPGVYQLNTSMTVEEMLEKVRKGMYEKALANRQRRTFDCKTIDEINEALKNGDGFIRAMWCGDEACEDKVKEMTGAGSRCIPLEQEHISDTCVCCGKKAEKMVLWAKAY